ncbi:DNA polymerase III subunit delta [Desulfofundulus sp. TPOSR]|uniref:DNA polymerase III subunit delta n=1 Tax=Desulfofundulus sp. TPOSR TaxID=2714340 RepID=UPI00140AB8E9|nr:DNA polymerase III subunit delta [Desulfofundulus sp. TPOSR]NHM27302.1 DNA polymerase III subunit delta [Desulfofundulus sp. TPOSR]
MKYYLDLINDLEKGNIAPVYLFYGQESFLHEKAVQRFREKLLMPPAGEFNLDILDGEEVTEGDIVVRAQTPPFMAGWRLVVVRHAPFFTGSPGTSSNKRTRASSRDTATPLLAYMQKPTPTTCLIFTTTHPVDQRGRLFKSLKETGRVVEFTYLKTRDLVRWLEKQARLAHKTITPAAAGLLVRRVGPSLFVLSQEMAKLISYTGCRETILEEDIYRLTVPALEENIFNVVDAIGERRIGAALKGIRELLQQGQTGPAILAMVARQFRLILQTLELNAGKRSPGEAAAKLGVHPFVAQKLLAQSCNFTREQVVTALQKLLDLDRAVKRGRLEFYPGIEMLLLEMGRGTVS